MKVYSRNTKGVFVSSIFSFATFSKQCFYVIFISASIFLQQNVVALIEGSQAKASAFALSEVTGIPLIRLHGNSRPFDQCEKAIQMSAGYRDYAHATLDILNKFGWKTIALVFEGKILNSLNFLSLNSTMTLL